MVYDCGTDCTTDASDSPYFSCSGDNCTQTTISLANQVQNPVNSLPTDNNGLSLSFPAVSTSTGTPELTGTLTLGIGTQSNNTYSGSNFFQAEYAVDSN